MSNIWEFLFFSIDLTFWVLLILLLKKVFNKRLSPIWQSGVWLILAVKGVVSLIFGVPYLNKFAYLTKSIVDLETGIDSSFVTPYTSFSPYKFNFVMPNSITDWLFVAYIFGAAIFAIHYVSQYVKLRKLIKKSCTESEHYTNLAKNIAETYSLKPCKAVLVDGIKAPFLCGVFNPIIVLPIKMEIDEKIILHELVHLKHQHNLQNIFWGFLRCLNWCNPILCTIFTSISNDIEISCDQRVLEKIDKSEIKDYGKMLLLMADEKYSKVVGTTSISNGGENIKKRIASIVFFKKYPKDLKLISSCINLLLVFLMISSFGFFSFHFDATAKSGEPTNNIIASSHKAHTEASAIDAYVKGIVYKNFDLLAIVSPKDKQKNVIDSSTNYSKQGKPEDISFFIQSPVDKYAEDCLSKELFEKKTADYSYIIYELNKEDNIYNGTLIITLPDFDECILENLEEKDTQDVVSNGALIIDIEVLRENNRWVVSQIGDYEVVRLNEGLNDTILTPKESEYQKIKTFCCESNENGKNLYFDYLGAPKFLTYDSEFGSGYLAQYEVFTVDSETVSFLGMNRSTGIGEYVDLSKGFNGYYRSTRVFFDFDKPIGEHYPYNYTMKINLPEDYDFKNPNAYSVASNGSQSGKLLNADDKVFYESGGGFREFSSSYEGIQLNENTLNNVTITIFDNYNEPIEKIVMTQEGGK